MVFYYIASYQSRLKLTYKITKIIDLQWWGSKKRSRFHQDQIKED